MIIGIPSYKRAGGVKTLEMLEGAFPKENVVISTQTMDDYEAYTKLYGEVATVVYKEGYSVGDNRNAILDYCQRIGEDSVIMLDDDITKFRTYTGRYIKGEGFKKLIGECVNTARQVGAVLFGTYPTDSRLQMSRSVCTNILTGTCIGILDTSLRFDTWFRIKEDYELCLRVLAHGKKCIRFNTFAPHAEHKSTGGCFDDWRAANYKQYAERLVAAYPDLVKPNQNKPGEVKFIKK